MPHGPMQWDCVLRDNTEVAVTCLVVSGGQQKFWFNQTITRLWQVMRHVMSTCTCAHSPYPYFSENLFPYQFHHVFNPLIMQTYDHKTTSTSRALWPSSCSMVLPIPKLRSPFFPDVKQEANEKIRGKQHHSSSHTIMSLQHAWS